MSKIWIPGSSGMLGKAFYKELSGRHEIICTDSNIDISDTYRVIEWVKSQKPEYIINCAAYTNVDGAEMDVERAWRANANGPMNIAIAAGMVGAVPVHFSTDYVFDGLKPISEDYHEEDKTNPLNHYGYSKAQGEKRFCSLSDDCFVVRTSWLFDSGGKNFLTTMLRLMSTLPELKVINDQLGRPTYAPDLASMVSELISDTFPGGVVHISNSGVASWYDFARFIHDAAIDLGLLKDRVNIIPVSTEEYGETKATRPKNSILNLNRVEKHLSAPIPSWKDAVHRCLVQILKESKQ